MARCPFMSTKVVMVTGSGSATNLTISSAVEDKNVDCIQSACQVWNPIVGECGANNKTTASAPPPPITKLVNEFLFKWDTDGNGKIYGYDFQLSDPPVGLRDLSKVPGFNTEAPSMTTDEYIASISSEE